MLSRFNDKLGVTETLVDARNLEAVLPTILEKAKQYSNCGFDIETEDSNRHDGLNKFMNLEAGSEKFKKAKKLVFDTRRTNITGFSVYFDGDDTAYYFNTFHADAENRIPLATAKQIVTVLRNSCTLFIHNAAYEWGMLKACWDIDLGTNYICTLQMAVSAYNDDEYDPQRLFAHGLGAIGGLMKDVVKAFSDFQEGKGRTAEQQELLNKVCGKTSDAAHSYNGLVKSIRYGYALKTASKSWLNYDQDTFEATLNGKAHMGLLTGEEVLHYGADDAVVCMRLFHAIYDFMMRTNPQVFKTFLEQENPMPRIFAKRWIRGVKINLAAVYSRQDTERANMAQTIRDLKQSLATLVPFDDQPSPRLWQRQKWYVGKNEDAYLKYRNRIITLATAPDGDDYTVCKQISGAVTERWMAVKGDKWTGKEKDKRGNLSHYMMQRVLLHDLCELPFVYSAGAITTDAEARGKMKDKARELAENPKVWIKEAERYGGTMTMEQAQAKVAAYQEKLPAVLAVIGALDRMTNIEQRIKLFINPYLYLTDPETQRMYPIISSRLNTRRMAAQDPNPMQLSKRGESTYIRGFYEPDREDHVLVSVDWSQIELVLMGEFSRDPAFYEAYGQIPYNDLHLGAAVSALKVFHPEFTVDDLKAVRSLPAEQYPDYRDKWPKVCTDPVSMEPLDQGYVYKKWRNDAGKPSNFGYWYSGSLMTVQEKMGWNSEEMWEATENYRRTFPVAEAYRVQLQRTAQQQGYIVLPDGHRRTRFEATQYWAVWMTAQFDAYKNPAISAFGRTVVKTIQRRAANQVVNAQIQGSCATLAKRSIIAIERMIESEGWDAAFWMPIHDELVFSVHRDQAVEFVARVKQAMCDHPEIISLLKTDATGSIGRTLEPYHPKKAPFGQVELDEAPSLPGILPKDTTDGALNKDQQQAVVEYLFGERKLQQAA
ncbi:DNA polymerase [Oceanimonas pelagia]|uniref:DNA-directed DNA polymerase n=1 Tax=Oceanimonas pelagia TaxID=3028314 RepID=A0AA50KL80_9GAMM|nr:DNA polymerase [Oceanimonas pelagia]WMC09568.1 DNA polymerase [Oceanimonas pelagia]